MADTAYEEKRIRDEAAGWSAKLNNTAILTETLRAFRERRNADERRDGLAHCAAVTVAPDEPAGAKPPAASFGL